MRQAEHIAIVGAIALVTVLCWVLLARMAGAMATGGDVGAMLGVQPWSAIDFASMLFMWIVMMVAMMLPTATPMTLVYAQVARKAERAGTILAPTGIFVAGYLLAWGFFSVAATLAQWGLSQAALLSPMMKTHSAGLGAALLVAAGLYQLTPLKDACLRHCRQPAHFFSQHWRPGRWGALRLGWHHGLFCLGCCSALMGLLFVGGVMNLLWIAAITFFVLLEKVIPYGVRGGRIAGLAMIAAGGLAWLGVT